MIEVYYAVGKTEQGVTTISFWSRPDKKDLFKETFIVVEPERMRFRVMNKLKINNFTLVEIK